MISNLKKIIRKELLFYFILLLWWIVLVSSDMEGEIIGYDGFIEDSVWGIGFVEVKIYGVLVEYVIVSRVFVVIISLVFIEVVSIFFCKIVSIIYM